MKKQGIITQQRCTKNSTIMLLYKNVALWPMGVCYSVSEGFLKNYNVVSVVNGNKASLRDVDTHISL